MKLKLNSCEIWRISWLTSPLKAWNRRLRWRNCWKRRISMLWLIFRRISIWICEIMMMSQSCSTSWSFILDDAGLPSDFGHFKTSSAGEWMDQGVYQGLNFRSVIRTNYCDIHPSDQASTWNIQLSLKTRNIRFFNFSPNPIPTSSWSVIITRNSSNWVPSFQRTTLPNCAIRLKMSWRNMEAD